MYNFTKKCNKKVQENTHSKKWDARMSFIPIPIFIGASLDKKAALVILPILGGIGGMLFTLMWYALSSWYLPNDRFFLIMLLGFGAGANTGFFLWNRWYNKSQNATNERIKIE